MEKKVVITIARQYCSGGLKVGKRLAEELGINCYDSEMFRLVSDSKNLMDNHVAHDARIKGTSFFTIAKSQYSGKMFELHFERLSKCYKCIYTCTD